MGILGQFEQGRMADEDEDKLIGTIYGRILQLVAMVCPRASRHREEFEYDLLRTRFFGKYFEKIQALMDGLHCHIESEVCLIVPDHEPTLTWGWTTPQEEITGLCAMMIEDATSKLPRGWRIQLWSEVVAQSKLPFLPLYQQALADPRSLQLAKLYREGRLQQTRFERTGKHDFALGKAAQYAAEGQILARVFNGAIIQHEENCPEVKDRMYRMLGPTLPIIHPFTKEAKP
jgi:hypothetical protein